jgi:hypothetical protein
MSNYTEVPASEIKVGDVLHPFTDLILHNFRVKTIEPFYDESNNKDYLIYRGDTIREQDGVFKCYPSRIVGLWDGDSTLESVNKTRFLIK